jgi:5-methylcytosine-specific restriction enzyme subunit McrC
MNSTNLRVIEITEYQPKYFNKSDISEEWGIILYEKYKNQVDVEFPSYKTRHQWKLTAKGWVGYIPVKGTPSVNVVHYQNYPVNP